MKKLSANYMENEGVVHNDYRKRLGVYVKGDFNPSDKVKISLSTNYIDTKSRSFGNSMSTVYGWAINRDMSDYRLADGMPNWECRYDAWDELTAEQRLNAGTSPYYSLYMDDAEAQSTRVILNGQISYEPIKNLVFTGKIGYDKAHSMTESISHPRFYDEEFTQEEHDKFKGDLKDRLGSLSFASSRSDRLTAQLTGNYYWKINDIFNLNFFLGAEYSEQNGISSSLGGRDFILGGDFFALENLNPDWLFLSDLGLSHSHRNKFGYFGEIRFDYKGMAQMSVTGRVDGSSTLRQAIEPVYFYPSVTAGVIFSELFKLQNDWFDYGKIRGNWAKVGKDAPANLFNKSYKQWSSFPDGGFGVDATLSTASPTLEPEMTTSWEIGADLRFFKSRTRLDVAYYSTKVDNQIITMRVSPSSGMILQTFNSGQVENYGIEATFAQDILQTKDFQWTANLNFGLNRGRLRKLPGDQIEYLATQLSNDFYCAALVGGSTTTMVGKDYARTESGDVLIDENGYPIISSNKNNHLGDREPDFLLGVGSTFTWKDLSLSFLIDGRCGGDVYNYTGRGLVSNGQSHFWEKYRNRKVIFNGVVDNGDGTYRPNTTPVILDSQTSSVYFHGVTSNFIEDGSYIRLSYVTLSYDFGKLMKKLGSGNPIKGLRASLTGRNLLLLTKYTGADPQIMSGATSGIGTMGIDNYSIPSTRNFNLNVNVTF